MEGAEAASVAKTPSLEWQQRAAGIAGAAINRSAKGGGEMARKGSQDLHAGWGRPHRERSSAMRPTSRRKGDRGELLAQAGGQARTESR